MKYGQMERIVRGMVVDVVEEGVAPLFDDSDLLDAANSVSSEYHGRRPEAFVSGNILSIGSPGLMASSRGCLSFTEGETSVNFFEMASSIGAESMQDGSVSVMFKCSSGQGGALFYCGGDSSGFLSVSIGDDGLVVLASDLGEGEDAELLVPGSFLDGRWRTAFVSLDDGTLYASVSGVGAETEDEGDYVGKLFPSVDQFVLGYSPEDSGGESYIGTNFSGCMASFVVSGSDGTELVSCLLDDGSGFSAVDSVGGHNGSVFGPLVEWLSEAEIPVAPWAERTFCLGVAAMLLSQRGKDAHHRKAADLMERLFRAEG